MAAEVERARLAEERAAGTAPRALYEDEKLVEALVGMIRTGGSYKNAGLSAGLGAKTVEGWIADADSPTASPRLVDVVTRLTRARGDAAIACEQSVHAGDNARALWLERMDRDQWGRHDKVSVDTNERPLTRDELAAMLSRNVGGEQ